jgi:uncharacterized RDD family membrane protein YckC
MIQREAETRVIPARPKRRVVAFIIDYAFASVVFGIAAAALAMSVRLPSGMTPPMWPWLPAVFLVFWVLVYGRDSLGGRSLGRRLLGLRVVIAESGRPAGILRCFAHNLLLVTWLPFPLLLLLHDGTTPSEHIVGTRVVELGSPAEGPVNLVDPNRAEIWKILARSSVRRMLIACHAVFWLLVLLGLGVATTVLPEYPAYAEELPAFRRRQIEEVLRLDAGEKLVLVSTEGVFDVRAGMSFLTDRRVGLYDPRAASALRFVPLGNVEKTEIRNVPEDEFVGHLVVNGGKLDLPVQGGNEWAKEFGRVLEKQKERYLSTPSADWSDADSPIPLETGDPTWGSRTAPVTIVMFGEHEDPRCEKDGEPCGDEVGTLIYLRSYYGAHQLRTAWKNRTRGKRPNGPSAAEVGVGVLAVGGNELFWEFAVGFPAYKIYTRPKPRLPTVSMSDYITLAKRIGVRDLEALERGLVSHRWARKVDADVRLAEKLGVTSSPHYFVNGIAVVGARDTDTFRRIIDAELVEANAALASGVRADRIYVHMSQKNVLVSADAGSP